MLQLLVFPLLWAAATVMNNVVKGKKSVFTKWSPLILSFLRNKSGEFMNIENVQRISKLASFNNPFSAYNGHLWPSYCKPISELVIWDNFGDWVYCSVYNVFLFSNNLNAVAIAFTVDFLFSLLKLTKYSLLFLCKIYANFAKNLICEVASFRNIVDEKKETDNWQMLHFVL